MKKETAEERAKRRTKEAFDNLLDEDSISELDKARMQRVYGESNKSALYTEKDILNIPIQKLIPFHSSEQKRQPWSIKENSESFASLTESIKENGIVTPLQVRKDPEHEGYYEILAGHRRRAASEILHLEELPCYVRDIQENWEAVLIVIDDNIHRTDDDVSIMEKAWAFRMKNDALKHKGARTDLTSTQVEQKLGKGSWTINMIAEEADESRATIQRLIRLTYLVERFQSFVDEKRIAVIPAVTLSYLSKEIQDMVYDGMLSAQYFKLTIDITDKLKEEYDQNGLTVNSINSILCGAYTQERNKVKKLNYQKVIEKSDMPEVIRLSSNDIKSTYIQDALKYYNKYLSDKPSILKGYLE